jgi:sugar lactone lactonase YvrE
MTGHLPARLRATLVLPLATSLLGACAAAGNSGQAAAAAGAAQAGATQPVAVREGLSGPEAVRYDPDQDVYFVSNWDGNPGTADNNGFISRLRPDGTVEQLRFVAGGSGGVTLHAPRGMAVTGDTLWVADLDAVRGFDRRSGAPLASVPFPGIDVGFLNDVAPGPDGALYVTDTGKDRVYRVAAGQVTVALADSALDAPNGITWDAANGRFIIVPIGGGHDILAWRPGTTTLEPVGVSSGGRYDGVELLAGGRVLVASQADSSLHLFEQGRGRPVIRLEGGPADIGVDTRRNRVAVPFVARNRVEIWEIPRE